MSSKQIMSNWHKLAVVEWRENEYSKGVYSQVNLTNETKTFEPIEYKLIIISDEQQISDEMTSVFDGTANLIRAELFDENENPIEVYDDYEIWINDTGQEYTEAQFIVYNGAITTVDVSTPCLQGVVNLRVSNTFLQTLIGLPTLTDLSFLGLRQNSMTSEQTNAIMLDLFEYAINTLKEDGAVNIIHTVLEANVNAPPTGDGKLALEALKGKGWTVDYVEGGGVTNIKNVYDLQAMILDKEENYNVCNDIEAAETKNWNDGAGFIPIGDKANPFTGIVNGNGCKIASLRINRPSEDYQAFIGYPARGCYVRDLHVNYNINGRYFCGFVGHGDASGTGALPTFERCSSSGLLTGISTNGGFIGRAYDSICIDCYSTANVTGLYAGGFVGQSAYRRTGQIIRCFNYSSLPFTANTGPGATPPNILSCKTLHDYQEWSSGTYPTGTMRNKNGILYRANKETNQEPPHADWDVLDIKTLTAAEFRNASNFAYTPIGTEPTWNETDAVAGDYDTGTIVEDAGGYYISTVDNNAARPSTTGTGWVQLGFDFEEVWRMGKDYPELRAFIEKIKTEFLRLRSRLEGRLR